MVYSIFGLYLHNNLGISFKKIGFLDGAIEGFSFVIKIFSGIFSDIMMNRKLFIAVGAFFLFIAKPIEATAISYWNLFSAKIMERLGNGLQATPRDAIVGDWAPPNLKGASFGMRQTLAALGSVVGSVIAFILFKKTNENFQLIFWLASIPSLFAVLCIVFFVKDRKKEITEKNINTKKFSIKDVKSLGKKYWITQIVASVYMLAKVTESIIIIHIVDKMGLPIHYGPICMIFYQIANSFISFPAGIISDRVKNRDSLIIVGIIMFIASDLIFIYGNSMPIMAIGLILLGGYVGISQSIFQAKIIDIVPPHLKGTGLGIFNFICAISLIIGGYASGYISDVFSTSAACSLSASIATISLVITYFSKKLA
jgi:MFS family permease